MILSLTNFTQLTPKVA